MGGWQGPKLGVRESRAQPLEGTGLRMMQKRDSDGSSHGSFPAPFLVFAVVAIAVFLLSVSLALMRLMVWNRRLRRMNEEGSAPVHIAGTPGLFAPPNTRVGPELLPPPPLWELKVSLFPQTRDERTKAGMRLTGAVPLGDEVDWSTVQPVAAALDKQYEPDDQPAPPAPAALPPGAAPGSGAAGTAPDEGPPASPSVRSSDCPVHVTVLVALPTPDTEVPSSLMAASSRESESFTSSGADHPLVRPSMETDLTGDMSFGGHKPNRTPSVRSRASAKDMGEARRTAYLETMERDSEDVPPHPTDSKLMPTPGGLSRSGSIVAHDRLDASQNPARKSFEDTDEEGPGRFAFGTLSLPLRHGPRGKGGDQLSCGEIQDLVRLAGKQHVPGV